MEIKVDLWLFDKIRKHSKKSLGVFDNSIQIELSRFEFSLKGLRCEILHNNKPQIMLIGIDTLINWQITVYNQFDLDKECNNKNGLTDCVCSDINKILNMLNVNVNDVDTVILLLGGIKTKGKSINFFKWRNVSEIFENGYETTERLVNTDKKEREPVEPVYEDYKLKYLDDDESHAYNTARLKMKQGSSSWGQTADRLYNENERRREEERMHRLTYDNYNL